MGDELIGKKFGQLTVIDFDGKRDRNYYYRCQCDCGNVISTRKSRLINGNAKSCGKCNQFEMVGKVFGRLTVLSKYESKDASRHTWYNCKCLCGNDIVVRCDRLKSGNTKSCHNCRENELIGTKVGLLTVIKCVHVTEPSGLRVRSFVCKCDCGNDVLVRGSILVNQAQMSCGCQTSKSNAYIANWLSNHNLNFNTEYMFEDLKGDKKPLRFDAAVFDSDGQIKCLIEYQGEQHYHPVAFSGDIVVAEEAFQKQQKYDNLKKEYCKLHNYTLIEIGYFDNIDEKLKQLIS